MDLTMDLRAAQCFYPEKKAGEACEEVARADLTRTLQAILRILEEPHLHKADYVAYRFISWPPEPWKGSYMSIRAVRKDGEAVLVAKIMDFPYALPHGVLEWRLIRRMSESEWSTLEREVRKARFWTQPTIAPEPTGPVTYVYAGPLHLFEGVTSERHGVVMEGGTPNPAMAPLQSLMLKAVRCGDGGAE